MATTTMGKIQERILDNLTIMIGKVQNHNAVGLTNINHEAEDFYCGLLNTAFGWNLVNQNKNVMNYPAIDLADPEAPLEDGCKGIAIQVTSTADRTKIQRTLNKFFLHRHNERFSRLIILIIGNKNDYRGEFTLNGSLSFDKKEDIWGSSELIQKIFALPEAAQAKVDRYLQAQHPISEPADASSNNAQEADVHDDKMAVLERMLVTEHFDFTEITRSKTQSFVGRRSIFSQIESWQGDESANQILILIGSAGMGKTALCAQLGHIIHVCSFDQEASTHARNIMGSLAYQLSLRLENYAEILSSNKEIPHLRNKNSIQLFNLFFVDTLRQIPKPAQPVIVVVDAIDEISRTHRNEFLVALSANQSQIPDWFKIILTTRPNSGVEAYFPYAPIVDMDQESEENRDDCREYLTTHLNKNGIVYSPEMLEQVIDNSDGNFLYINYLVEDIVSRSVTILDASDFPKNIGVFYLNWLYRAFQDNPDVYRMQMLPILQILCSAKSKLTIEELSQISGESEVSIMELIHKTRSIISRRADRTVSFYHKSVKDWLCDPLASTDYFVDSTIGNRLIVDYIRAEYDLTGMLPEIGYITKYGGTHLIEEREAELFYQLYMCIPLEQRDEFCHSFSQVPVNTLVRFLMAVKKKMDAISFWSFLAHVLSVCSDMGAYQKTIDICLTLLQRVDRNLKILLRANLCIALKQIGDLGYSLKHVEEMQSLYHGLPQEDAHEISYVGSVAHNISGYACRLTEQTERAKEHHVSSIHLAELLMNNPYRTLQILAAQQVYHSYSNLSRLVVSFDSQKSEEYSRERLGIAHNLKKMSNEYRHQLYELNAYNSLIECLFRNYRYFEAYALCEEAVPYAEELVIHHTSIKSNHMLAVLYSLVGKAELKQNRDAKKCLTYYHKGFQLIEKNWRMLPSKQTKEALAEGYMKLGRLYLRENATDTAILYMKQGIAILEHLQKLFPQRSYAKSLSNAYVFCARACLKQNDFMSASNYISAALEILLSMAFSDEQIYSDTCWCYQLLGEIAEKEGRPDDAFNHYILFRDTALDGLQKHSSVTAVIYVLFADMTLAFLETDRSGTEIRKNYAIHAISSLLAFYEIEPAQQLLLDAAEKILVAQRFDLLHVSTTLKEFLGSQYEAMGETDVRSLKNAIRSLDDFVD